MTKTVPEHVERTEVKHHAVDAKPSDGSQPTSIIQPGRKATFEEALEAVFQEDGELMNRLAK